MWNGPQFDPFSTMGLEKLFELNFTLFYTIHECKEPTGSQMKSRTRRKPTEAFLYIQSSLIKPRCAVLICCLSGKITWLCCLCPHQEDNPVATWHSAYKGSGFKGAARCFHYLCLTFSQLTFSTLWDRSSVCCAERERFFFLLHMAMCWCADCYSSSTESHRRVSHICSACCRVFSSSRRLGCSLTISWWWQCTEADQC